MGLLIHGCSLSCKTVFLYPSGAEKLYLCCPSSAVTVTCEILNSNWMHKDTSSTTTRRGKEGNLCALSERADQASCGSSSRRSSCTWCCTRSAGPRLRASSSSPSLPCWPGTSAFHTHSKCIIGLIGNSSWHSNYCSYGNRNYSNSTLEIIRTNSPANACGL